MKKIYFLIIYVIISLSVSAQNADSLKKANDNKPVRDPWACNIVVDDQTTLTPNKGNLEFVIQHRFTGLGNGAKDLYGLYGASDIQLGFNYGLTKNLMIGFGTEKDKKYQEFLIKWKLLEQNRGGSIPVSISLFGNACINGLETSYFGNNFKNIDRLSYFGQVIVSRKLCDAFSFQVAGSYSHINKVDAIKNPLSVNNNSLYHNDAFGISAAARVKVYHELDVMAEYDQGLYTGNIGIQQLEPKPNVAFGFEKSTSTHTFQLFVSTFRGIIPQQNFIENQADFRYISQLMLGFNITIRFY